METKTTYKSFRYKASTAWNSARRGTLSASGKPSIDVGSPPEFKGEADIWAPEELLVGSVNTCMMLTFLTLAQAKGLTPVRYESEAEGLLENIEGSTASQKLWFDRAWASKTKPNSDVPEKSWTASKHSASSRIP